MRRIHKIPSYYFYLFLYLFVIIHVNGKAQEDLSWWNEAHNWDGVSHWTNYIIFSPYYMGPNSIPVPFSQQGIVKGRYEFEIDFQNHIANGDNTQNLFMRLYFPVVENLIAVELYGVPYEQYQMDEKTVIERRTRNLSGEGTAVGDFYFSTILQLIKDQKFPDVALRLACRTASGSKLSDARYTDAPGYFFDASFGRNFQMGSGNNTLLRLHGMLGFYSWQMNLPDNRQNDALLYGIGLSLHTEKWIINNDLEGYFGYMGNREVIVGNGTEAIPFHDRPVIYKISLYRKTNYVDIGIKYQHGFKDYPYQSVNLSAVFHISKNRLLHRN